MQEQQQNIDNLFKNSEKYQLLENSTIIKSNQINEYYNYNNNNDIKTILLSKSTTDSNKNQLNNLKFYTEIITNNQQNDNNNDDDNVNDIYDNTTSENAKDLLINTTNYTSQNNYINSHLNNNINTIISPTLQNDINNKSAFNCKTNSDNNLLNDKNINLLKKPILNYSINMENNSTISPIIQSKLDNNNIYNQRCYVDDVHNYSKKLNGYELSSKSSNNTTSSCTDEYDSDDDYNDNNKLLINNKNYTGNETDLKKKWLKNIKKCNDNKILKTKFINNNNNNNQNHLNNDDKLLINNKSKTPDSGVPDDDDNNKLTPDHHARRPMNAFLIFCKRHRGIVRDKYKNVENRQITKILGEWWANMTVDQKSCYTNLAKENKDQFLSTHPDFKWYKLPAPPLRTLTTRPLHNNTLELKQNDDDKIQNQQNNTEHITLKNNNQHHQHHKKLTSPNNNSTNNVGQFKFADETQMGSLNNLFCNDNTNDHNNISTIKSDSLCLNNNQTNELQNALSDTSNYLCNTIVNTNYQNINEPFENIRDYVKNINNSGIKRKLSSSTNNDNSLKKMLHDNSLSSSEDDCNLINRKLSRKCKGKKYQELINSGQISILPKKLKKSNNLLLNNNNDHQINKDSSSDSDYYNHTSSIQQNDYNGIIKNDDEKYQIINNININNKKQYDNIIDFNLDNKIMSLPAQNFEQYLNKKQESKSKKKINSKRRKGGINNNKKQINNNLTNINDDEIKPIKITGQTIQDIKEQIVGSQKRKARKESITRRDVNAIQNETKLTNYVEFSGGAITTPTTITTSSNCDGINLIDINNIDKPKTEQNFRATDLLFLAEVASNVDE